jgi:hypothetical protein
VVEYVLLLASGSFRSLASDLSTWISGRDWHALAYVLLALVVLRLALWAFRLPE